MFTHTFLLPKNFCLYEQVAEGQSGSPDALAGEKKPETPEQQAERIVQEKEEARKEEEQKINTAKIGFEDSRQKLIEQAKRIEAIGNERVEILLKNEKFFPGKTPEQRREIAQKIISDYINASIDEYKTLQANLSNPELALSQDEIESILREDESKKFSQFVREEIKKIYILSREERYLSSISESEREAYKDAVREFSTQYKYKEIYDRIKKESEDAGETLDNSALRKKVNREIDMLFIAYAEQKNIPIDGISILSYGESSQESDDEAVPVVEYASGNLLSAMSDYQEEAKVMIVQKEVYLEEVKKYEPLEEREVSEYIMTEVPRTVSTLQSGESTTFISTGSSTDTLYYVESEGDGQYTVSFGAIRMKDVPKKELDVIVSLNKIPLIDKLFSVNSSLYRTLFREYRNNCQSLGIDPTSNPPYDFIRYIYSRFNDVYRMKNGEEGSDDLLSVDISGLPRIDQGKRISDILMTNKTLRDGVLKKLQAIKVINSDNRLNLSEFPK